MNIERDVPFYTDIFLERVLGVTSLPQHLYHYTSLETFALILKNKTLRFNRLDLVNDAEEAMAEDLASANTTQFVSCWTAESSELVPLWYMYNQMKGIRFRLPINMFEGRVEPEIYDHGGAVTILRNQNSFYLVKRKSQNPILEPFLNFGGGLLFGPNPVFYSDQDEFRKPRVLFDMGDPYNEGIKYIGVNTIDLGNVKSMSWDFEKEWRFKISYFGIGEVRPLADIGKEYFDFVSNPITTDHIDIRLDSSVFDDCEVTTGPLMTNKDLSKLNNLINKYAPHSTIKASSLKINSK